MKAKVQVLEGKRIALGVTGSVAAYKAISLASTLHQAGSLVDVALTQEALRFLTPLAFQAITHRAVLSDLWAPGMETNIAHVSLGRESDLYLIAPATAHSLAKLAHGLADDPVSVTALAARCPVIVAPAMDAGMYTHPATAANVRLLSERGIVVVPPEEGHLASGLQGTGRLASLEAILDAVRSTLGRSGDLAGRRIVVTAGGTREPLDPVRVLANRSSGKMGYAIAEVARDRGAEVTLISGPTSLRSPGGVDVRRVETALQMSRALQEVYPLCDVLVMAAAVADFTVQEMSEQKVKRGLQSLDLTLIPTPDLLLETAKSGRGGVVRVGFAAETRDLLDQARGKLERKKLDMIVANDVSATDSGFDVDTNRASLLWRDGRQEDLPLLQKIDLAERILDAVRDQLDRP